MSLCDWLRGHIWLSLVGPELEAGTKLRAAGCAIQSRSHPNPKRGCWRGTCAGGGVPHSPPLRRVAGGREEVVAEGTVDGTQDLQVVDDPLWGQVVPQRRPHHRVCHILDADETGRESAPGPAGPRTPRTAARMLGRSFFFFLKLFPQNIKTLLIFSLI